MKKRLLNARTIIFLVAGALITYFLLSESGSMESTMVNIFNALGQANVLWLVIAFVLFALTQFIRAWRWQVLSWEYPIKLNQSLPLTAIHVGLAHLLPVRLSDVALVGLFKKYASLPLGNGAATVILAKIMDVIAMGFVLACSFVAGFSGAIVYVAASISVLGVVSLFFLPLVFSFIKKMVNATAGPCKVVTILEELSTATEITAERKQPVIVAMALSITGWTIKLFMFYSLLHSVGVRGLPIWQIFTASAITDLIMALPVHGLLSLGTVEAGWVAGFKLTGVTEQLPGGLTVIEAGFSVHFLWLFMAVLLMLGGIASLLIKGKRGKI